MKKIIIILFMSVVTSCLDIDVMPQNAVTFENYFKTEKDIQTFMNTVRWNYRYSVVQPVPLSTQIEKGYYADYVGDFMVQLARDLDVSLVHTPFNTANSWGYFYTLITCCNIMIENIDKAEIAQERIDMYLGQTYFYRAHAYFWIAQNWGDAVIELNSRNTEPKAREPFHKVLNQAIEDAQKAITLLPAYKNLIDESGKHTTNRDIVSKEAGYSLVAYIYAWKASLNNEPELYKSAIMALDEVLKQSEYFDLATTSEEVCTQLLRGVNHRESIFEVDNGWSENGMMNNSSSAQYVTQFPVDPTKKEGDIKTAGSKIYNTTVDRMFPKGDTRREAYFYKTDSYRDETSLVITGGNAFPYKFRYPLLVTSGTDIGRMKRLGEARVMFRVADLLLLRAECYVRTYNDGSAIADLNRVRGRSNAALYGVNPEPGDLRYTIFKEREKELLWENHRYFDVIRNGYYSEISKAYAKLTPNDIKNGATYLPVVFGAFSDNALMTQNKYWLSRY